jgi:flavin reductase (DIM6/NTAB) family NADH-FMN oxidoreductase RutF
MRGGLARASHGALAFDLLASERIRRPARATAIRPHRFPMSNLDAPPIARALGRIPTGLYIVSTLGSRGATGFVGSFVMQMGFEPPTVCVGIGKSRPQLAEVRRSGRFALSILDKQSAGLMTPFLKKLPEGTSPFDGLRVISTASGLSILADALAWIECRVSGEIATNDHVVIFGEVEEGELLREGDPSIHLRRNGLTY